MSGQLGLTHLLLTMRAATDTPVQALQLSEASEKEVDFERVELLP